MSVNSHSAYVITPWLFVCVYIFSLSPETDTMGILGVIFQLGAVCVHVTGRHSLIAFTKNMATKLFIEIEPDVNAIGVVFYNPEQPTYKGFALKNVLVSISPGTK
jgi:hypothetical protein